MKNNDNKKPAGLWVHRLFKKSGTSLPSTHSKTNFAHRYRDGHVISERNPFSALFSGMGKQEPNLATDTAGIRYSSEEESSSSKAFSFDSVESAQTGCSNPSQAFTDRFDLSGSAALSDQFTVLNCYDETPDVKTFRLGRPDGRVFDYLPGQYLTLSIAMYKRSYSLASSPTRSGNLEITVKRDPNGGVVSNWLNDNLKVGDKLYLKGPFGKFSCVKQPCEKILFLAAGSGIVPIMSMLRWLADTDAGTDVLLLLSFRNPEDIIYRDELKLIAARHKNIKMAITLTAEAVTRYQWPGLTGRVNEKMIADLAPDLPERTVYLCGPDSFMAECKKNLLELKLPAEKLFCESFTVNSPLIKPANSGLAQPARTKTGHYRVRFARSDKTIIADGRMTLLELVEKSGIIVEHECRNGQCGECMIKCLKGRIEMTVQAEIDDHNRKKGWVYACCAYPSSDIVLDI